MIIDSAFGHQLLEIADPIKDLSENELIEVDYKVTHVDMGPYTFEGDVYHVDYSVNALIKRAKE